MEFEIFIGEETLLLCFPSKRYYFKPNVYWYYDAWLITFNGHTYKQVIIIFKLDVHNFSLWICLYFYCFLQQSVYGRVLIESLTCIYTWANPVLKTGNLEWVCIEFMAVQDKLGFIFKDKFLFPLILCKKVGVVSVCVLCACGN